MSRKIKVHGEQRHLQTHARVAQEMGTPPENIIIGDVGRIIELTPHSAQLGGTVPSGRVFVDGYGVAINKHPCGANCGST